MSLRGRLRRLWRRVLVDSGRHDLDRAWRRLDRRHAYLMTLLTAHLNT